MKKVKNVLIVLFVIAIIAVVIINIVKSRISNYMSLEDSYAEGMFENYTVTRNDVTAYARGFR